MKILKWSATFLLAAISSAAQTGGSYDLDRSVIAGGGGSNSNGGTFRVDGTIGQPVAGTVSPGGSVTVIAGFWTRPDAALTAAEVTISGRVTSAEGRGIRNAHLTLTAPDGSVRTVITHSHGEYRFENVPAGVSYVLVVSARRFSFAEATRILSVNDNISGVDFVAQ